jgi:hypothetical protein
MSKDVIRDLEEKLEQASCRIIGYQEDLEKAVKKVAMLEACAESDAKSLRQKDEIIGEQGSKINTLIDVIKLFAEREALARIWSKGDRKNA